MGQSMFMSEADTAGTLGKTVVELKNLVRSGQLREFRDAATVNYKRTEVEELAKKLAAVESASSYQI